MALALANISEDSLNFDEEPSVTESILNFVDLAGSERASVHDESKGKKDRVQETKHINKSLFFLNQIISLKAEAQPEKYIPYRNSPLTKILRSSIGGNAKTLIILCCSPGFNDLEQTISTLRFGSKAKQIHNKVQKNVQENSEETIKKIVDEYEKKISELEVGIANYANKANITQEHAGQKKRVNDLENQKKTLMIKLMEVQTKDKFDIKKFSTYEPERTFKSAQKENFKNMLYIKPEKKIVSHHSTMAGVVESYDSTLNAKNNEHLKEVDRADALNLLREDIIHGFKVNCNKFKAKVQELEAEKEFLLTSNENLQNIITNFEKDIKKLKQKNET